MEATNKKFVFMESYLNSIDELMQGDRQLGLELAYAIIQYGINNKEPDSPILRAIIAQVKVPINKGKGISEIRSDLGKKHSGNQYTMNDGKRKSNGEADLNLVEQNGTNEKIIGTKGNKMEQNKNKKENKNNITLSKDNEAKAYGNEEVNRVIELVKAYNNGIIDGTQKNQRNFAMHLVKKLKEIEGVKDGRFTWDGTLEIILKIISQNKFYAPKLSSPESIYRNLGILMQVCKTESNKLSNDEPLQVI